MLSIAQLKPGDLIRISRIYVKGNVGWREGKMWAVVGEVHAGTVDVEIFYGPADALHEDEVDAADSFTRFREPAGYACAALAKWRLTGEKTSV